MSFLPSSTSTFKNPPSRQTRIPSIDSVENEAKGALLSPVLGSGNKDYDLPMGAETQEAIEAIGVNDDGQSILSPIAMSRDSLTVKESSETPKSSEKTETCHKFSTGMNGVQISGNEYFGNTVGGQESRIEGEEEIEKAQTLVGASSKVFMEHLRGAAFRRKMNLTRSRDSLVAKEKVQREALAACKVTFHIDDQHAEKKKEKNVQFDETGLNFKARPVPMAIREGTASGLPNIKKRPSTVAKSPLLGRRRESNFKQSSVIKTKQKSESEINRMSTFKAKPLPRTTGSFGHGGQVGLPQVSKRQTTVPKSPALGSKRRSEKNKAIFLSDEEKENQAFKARPAPKTTDADGHGGLSGISKVEKRPLTIPLSPLLGNRRPKADKECEKSSTSVDLIGINFIEKPAETPRESDSHNIKPFVPYSEERARQRADFDEKRRANEDLRERKESEMRQQQITALQKELQRIRPVIRGGMT